MGKNNAPAPSSSEDAKPNVDALDAEAELPSDPPVVEPDPPAVEPDRRPVESASTESTSVNAPPARRLASLNQPGRGSPATRGRRGASKPRFTGRRSQAQREELQKAEEQKRKEEEAKTAEEARRDSGRRDGGRVNNRGGNNARGVGTTRARMRGRGRGGYVGDHERRQILASGPFSAGQVSEETRLLNKRRPRGSGWSGWRAGQRTGAEKDVSRRTHDYAANLTAAQGLSAVNENAGPSTDVKPVLDANGDVSMDVSRAKQNIDGGYISSDEEDEKGVRRMNIEDLGVIDLTQENDEYGSFAPVRVARVPHKERTLGINADGVTNQEGAITVDANDVATVAALEKSKGKQKAKEVEITGEKKSFHAVYSDSEDGDEPERSIKPDSGNGEASIGTPDPIQPSSADMLPQEPPSSPETKRKGKEKITARAFSSDSLPVMPEYQTREETEEWERYQHDLQLIRSELGQAATEADKDGDSTMTGSQSGDKRADKVYLFQFPPVLPDLLPIPVKPDPETTNGEADVMDVEPPNNASNPIAVRDDGDQDTSQPKLPSGAVGKLKVHASGRVTLDWGGSSLSLGMGTEASFLQDVLVATLPDQKEGVDPTEAGQAVNMGQVKGKFVVTPDWEELLG